MDPTNSTADGWMRNPWSHTGYIGQFLGSKDDDRVLDSSTATQMVILYYVPGKVGQPDNAEYLLNPSGVTVEACLSINNDWYDDGVAWHDTACYHKKPFICEDSEPMMRKARNLSPNIIL